MSRNNIRSMQYWVLIEDMVAVAEILSESGLWNCIVDGESTKDGNFILIEVDYDETNSNEMKYIIDLTKATDKVDDDDDEDD